MTLNTEAAIWERVIEPNTSDFSEEAARFIVALDFKPTDHARMEDLAGRSDEGTLTTDEQAELDNYVRVGNILALIQSKARLSLRRTSHSF